MQLSKNTVLITGGSSGIGSAMAERLLALDNEVIVTGRHEKALLDFKAKHPRIHIRVSDAGTAADRIALTHDVLREFPALNVLINNAGIQRKIDMAANESWEEREREISINLSGPIHFCALFVPHLQRQVRPLIVNVSSGLAFVPFARVPIYCATKAGLHSFTMSLREQLKQSPIAVTEIIPPAVKTNLGGAHDFGEELDDFTDSVIEQLGADAREITFGTSTKFSGFSRSESDEMFRRINGPM
jgi:uncharacterized oxidoreductase